MHVASNERCGQKCEKQWNFSVSTSNMLSLYFFTLIFYIANIFFILYILELERGLQSVREEKKKDTFLHNIVSAWTQKTGSWSPLTSSVLLSCSCSAFCSSSTWERSSEICCSFNLRNDKDKIRVQTKTIERKENWNVYGQWWESLTKKRKANK